MSAAARNQIDITLSLSGDTIAAVEVLPRGRLELAPLFSGKPTVSLLNALPRLFSLCAIAHQVAFLSAVEAARGEDINLATRQHRIVLVVAERLAELLRGLFVGHLALDFASMAAIRALMQDASVLVGSAAAGSDAFRREATGRVADKLAAFGLSNEGGALMPGSPLARRIAELDKLALKPMPTQHSFLSVADDRTIVEGAFVSDAGFFGCTGRQVYMPETGPWARHVTRNGLSPSRSGPAERMKARIDEIAQLCAWLKAGAHDEAAADGTVESYRLGPGRGAAAVECARGRLYHKIELDRYGKISRFEFLAPTEWNFHPRGPLVRSLQGAVLTAERHGQAAVRAMIASFDPCVAFTVSFGSTCDA
ncbi:MULTISPECIES: nickel-dependent hydrogenase large subunit [unclassified Bradyrhizobium]|uniref:nickel-dependent hydrogenase large subunit n=1 Tax=unclassified Bradyrhizobium TaxID=2631580 RepID=UPI002479A91D|nr:MULTISPECIES: nickel-dependent hydrogenase large subunit [unclassified Bradyrhizobium]WGR93614.1 nickel-dependent hydrogenase large subunit [Bradyrhizobium sp. ISRA435]WGR98179.1 nickel-dependent hydrogenase large subunit [Bradyrhizobium sp. ISRA436]WGS05068.1 nickel-dependent hydrogenase large subunit [Bradyrhizobium sp. ISRA437]WGS11953.1 nickel-dependent hydrogenase large subunit [Bradyrhizobium sp. ISRA443]WGS19416.1 nickel-dependent hydrogenase large subunit [Bradyrhizobium sp. ISRA463